MQRLKNDPALAGLPAPTMLTPDQLMAVVAGASALLSKGTESSEPVVVTGAVSPLPALLSQLVR